MLRDHICLVTCSSELTATKCGSSWLCGTMVERWSPICEPSPCTALDLQLTADHLVGKPSTVSQPTRPTQPFSLFGLISE